MARDGIYRRGDGAARAGERLSAPVSVPWEELPVPTPLADLAAVRDAAAEHGRPFGPPPAEGGTPC